MARRGRKDAGRAARDVVRMSVPLPAKVHARLCAVAADRQMDRSELAASILVAAVRDVTIGGMATVPGHRADASGTTDAA